MVGRCTIACIKRKRVGGAGAGSGVRENIEPEGVGTGLEQSIWSSIDLIKNLCQSNGEPSNTLGDRVIKKKSEFLKDHSDHKLEQKLNRVAWLYNWHGGGGEKANNPRGWQTCFRTSLGALGVFSYLVAWKKMGQDEEVIEGRGLSSRGNEFGANLVPKGTSGCRWGKTTADSGKTQNSSINQAGGEIPKDWIITSRRCL